MNELMYSCPKYEACNAPVCPLWPDWRKLSFLKGDRTCFYLREVGKAGGEQRVRARLPENLATPIVEVCREIVTQARNTGRGYCEHQHVLMESHKSTSKLAAGDKLCAKSSQSR